MKRSVVIPCYNEIDMIAAIIDAVRAAPYQDKQLSSSTTARRTGRAGCFAETCARALTSWCFTWTSDRPPANTADLARPRGATKRDAMRTVRNGRIQIRVGEPAKRVDG